MKNLFIFDLEESIYFVNDDIFNFQYNVANEDELDELAWTKQVYETILSKIYESPYDQNSFEVLENVIGDFQADMLDYSRRDPKTSRMFMYMFNVAAEFLEYIWTMMEEENG